MSASLRTEPAHLGSSTSTSDIRTIKSGLEPYPYDLDLDCPVPWHPSQETVICQDYPFSSGQEESLEEFVIRRYLETLWLPESIMPLHHLVASLRRVPCSASGLHPLHLALKPLLLSVRATQEKYHSELPQILQDGGGAGELEETVMWFAWGKEKFEQDAGGAEDGKSTKEAEEEWKKSWMERLERREVQIQILLYLQILALPAPLPTTPVVSSKKRKRKPLRGPPTPAKPLFPPTSSMEATVASTPPTPAKSTTASTAANVGDDLPLEDRLEYFMDRLSLWQLVSSLNSSGPSQPTISQSTAKNEKDWMQTFCEDVVEPLFKNSLPAQCALLRTKVFPHSPFSDRSDGTPSPPPPDLRAANKGKTKRKRPASPLRLTELQKPRAESSQRAEPQEPGTAPVRHRSRSRSVSISVEEVRARGASRGGVASSKSLFKDEVEMKRTAPRAPRLHKPAPSAENQPRRTFSRQNSAANALPAADPCAPQPRLPAPTEEHKTLAVDTPVKKRMKVESQEPDIVMDSPDALLLTGKRRGGSDDHGEWEPQLPGAGETFVMDTPVKKRSKR